MPSNLPGAATPGASLSRAAGNGRLSSKLAVRAAGAGMGDDGVVSAASTRAAGGSARPRSIGKSTAGALASGTGEASAPDSSAGALTALCSTAAADASPAASRPPNRRCKKPGRLASSPSRRAKAWRCRPLSSPSSTGSSRSWLERPSNCLAKLFSGLLTSRGNGSSCSCPTNAPSALETWAMRSWRRCSESSTAFSRRGIRPAKPLSMSSLRRMSRSSCMHWSTALSVPSAARLLRTRPRRSRSSRASQRFSSFSWSSRLCRYLAFQRSLSMLINQVRREAYSA